MSATHDPKTAVQHLHPMRRLGAGHGRAMPQPPIRRRATVTADLPMAKGRAMTRAGEARPAHPSRPDPRSDPLAPRPRPSNPHSPEPTPRGFLPRGLSDAYRRSRSAS
jgi:hypothetical protein